MVGFILFLIAWILIPILTLINFVLVANKGYFISTALSIDRWGNREFRTLWNKLLKKDGGYSFGVVGETISSALGKNERDGTLTKSGKILCCILNKFDKDHCKNSIVNNK